MVLALTLIAPFPAGGEDAPASFGSGWDDPDWVLESEAARGGQPGPPAPADPAARAGGGDPAIRLGPADVRFGAVDGAPGASFTPRGGPVSLGVAVAPRGGENPDPVAGFGALPPEEDGIPEFDNGFLGAFTLSETDGSVTRSMSVTAPFSGGDDADPTRRAPSEGVKTMFGLGYAF